jgi:hypothetical protein
VAASPGFGGRWWYRRPVNAKLSPSHGHPPGRHLVPGADRLVVQASGHVQLGQRGSIQFQGRRRLLRLRPARDPVPAQRGLHPRVVVVSRAAATSRTVSPFSTYSSVSCSAVIGAGGVSSVQPGRHRGIPAASRAAVTRPLDRPRRCATSATLKPSLTYSCRRLSTGGGVESFGKVPVAGGAVPSNHGPACGPAHWNRSRPVPWRSGLPAVPGRAETAPGSR